MTNLIAPKQAVEHLNQNPGLAPQFKEKYGYVPAPESALSHLKANPDLEDAFKEKYGYIPKIGPSVGDRLDAARKDFTAGVFDLFSLLPAAIEANARGKVYKPKVEDLLQTDQGPIQGKLARRFLQPRVEQTSQFEQDLEENARRVKDTMQGIAQSARDDVAESIKNRREQPIVEDGEINVMPLLEKSVQVMTESISYGGGIVQLGKTLGGKAASYGAANSILISADTFEDAQARLETKLIDQGLDEKTARAVADDAGIEAMKTIAPIAFVTGRLGEGTAAMGAGGAFRRAINGAKMGAISEVPEEVAQQIVTAQAAGDTMTADQLVETAILSTVAGGVHGGIAGAAGGTTQTEIAPEETISQDEQALTEAMADNRTEDQAETKKETLKTPDEFLHDNHVKKAKEAGLTDEQAELFAPTVAKDPVTGYYVNRDFEPTLKRAQEFVEQGKGRGVLVMSDVGNMGGGNAALGSEPDFDQQMYTPMAQAVQAELEKTGDVIPVRTGGDELGFIVTNATNEDIEAAMEKSLEWVNARNVELGIDQVPNPKYPNSPERGVGLYYGMSNIKPGEDLSAIIKSAARQVGVNKKVQNNVTRPSNETTESQQSEPTGAGRGTVEADPRGREERASDANETGDVEAVRAGIQQELKGEPNSTLYAGIPFDKAYEGLVDRLGIKEDGVTVLPNEQASEPGVLSSLVSPSKVAKWYPKFKRYFKWADEAQETQERLRKTFRNRLKEVNRMLGGGMVGQFSLKYEENQKALNEIRLTEDMMGQTFTDQQLRDQFGASDEVIKAKKLLRAAYDHALTIANKTRELRGKLSVSRREGYVPHFFHNYMVKVDGQPVGSGKTVQEAIAIGNKLARQGQKVVVTPKQFKFPGEEMQAAIVSDLNYFKIQKQLENVMSLTLGEAQELSQNLIRMKGRSRFVGNFYQRKGAEGFVKDLGWADQKYFNMISRYVALDKFKQKSISAFEREFGDFNAEKKGLANYTKNYINDINGVPTAIEDVMNSSLMKVPLLNKFLGHYLGDRPALQLASATTNGVAIVKLGLYNVATALVNGSQLIGAQALLGPKAFANGLRRAAHLSPRDRGILKQAGVDVQQGLESGSGYSKAHQMGAIFQASTFFFQKMEERVRATTTLGAYYKARKAGNDHEQALEFASGVNRRVNFDYSIADAPEFIRRTGPLGQVLFQFKKFPIKMMEFMTELEGAEHARFWIPFFLLGGYYALPGIEALKEMLKSTFGFDMELEMKGELMDWAAGDPAKEAIAETIMYGAFSQAGVDISRRIGGGDFVPSSPSDWGGPAFSTVVRTAQMVAKENWPETLRSIATAPGNIAIAMYGDGTSAYDRDRKVADLSLGDRVVKGVGFRPLKEAIETDVKRTINYETQRYRDKQKKIIDQIIAATVDYGDTIKEAETKQDVLDAERVRDGEIQEAVDMMRKDGIVVTPEQIKNEILAKNLTRSQRAILNSSKIIKAKTSRIYQFSQE